MKSDYFCYVEENEIKFSYIRRGSVNPITGKKMGLLDEDDIYQDFNLFPIVEDKPTYNEFSQKLTGPTLEVDLQNKVVNKTWVVEDIPIDIIKSSLIDKLNSFVKDKEIGGIYDNAYGDIRTDEKTQIRLSQAMLQVTIDENTVYNWKMSNGSFIELDKTKIIEIYTLVNTHVEKCFDIEKQLTEKINLIDDVAELENLKFEIEWNNLY
jgi:hypothetical protein